MKLTKQQITALAQSIIDDYRKEAQEVKNTEEYINFENSLEDDEIYINLVKIRDTFLTIDEQVRKNLNGYYYIEESVKNYVHSKRDKVYKPNLPNIGTIENKIILKTIEADNLQELVDSVKESL